MINVLFSAKPPRWVEYEPPLRAAFAAAGLEVNLAPQMAADLVDYIVCAPNGPVTDFSVYPRLKAVLTLWAGVETITGNTTLTVPLCRMVDHGLTEGMVEWVTGHVLRHHLGIDAFLAAQSGDWLTGVTPPLARDRKVCILGLGALGAACGQALAALNFKVHGWARSAKSIDGITCHHGDSGLKAALDQADMAVLLLPDTPATTGVMNAKTLAHIATGGVLLNPGRGPLIDNDALIAALDAGALSHATLDAFEVEPLPPSHAFWAHPKVTVTPHIASETRSGTASQVIAENVRRGEVGEPFLHCVDRAAGY